MIFLRNFCLEENCQKEIDSHSQEMQVIFKEFKKNDNDDEIDNKKAENIKKIDKSDLKKTQSKHLDDSSYIEGTEKYDNNNIVSKIKDEEPKKIKTSEEEHKFQPPSDKIIENKPKSKIVMIKCPICLEEIKIQEIITLNCDHKFCKFCVSNHCESKIESGLFSSSLMICPQDNCKHPINYYIIKACLYVKSFEKYDAFLTKHSLESNNFNSHESSLDKDQNIPIIEKNIEPIAKNNEKYVNCPKCQSNYIIDSFSKSFNCPQCKEDFCSNEKCLRKWSEHIGRTCDDFINKLQYSNDATFENYIKEHKLQRCPVCNVVVEKIKNCNYVQCGSIRCQKKTTFCYLCGQLLKQNDLATHYLNDSAFSTCKKNKEMKESEINQKNEKSSISEKSVINIPSENDEDKNTNLEDFQKKNKLSEDAQNKNPKLLKNYSQSGSEKTCFQDTQQNSPNNFHKDIKANNSQPEDLNGENIVNQKDCVFRSSLEKPIIGNEFLKQIDDFPTENFNGNYEKKINFEIYKEEKEKTNSNLLKNNNLKRLLIFDEVKADRDFKNDPLLQGSPFFENQIKKENFSKCKGCDKPVQHNHGKIRMQTQKGKNGPYCYVYCPTSQSAFCNYCNDHPKSIDCLQTHVENHIERQELLSFKCNQDEIPMFIDPYDQEGSLGFHIMQNKEEKKVMMYYYLPNSKEILEDQPVIFFKTIPIPIIQNRLMMTLKCKFCQNDVWVIDLQVHLMKNHRDLIISNENEMHLCSKFF